MSVRVQVILGNAEGAELKRLAREEGVSLSSWLREAGRIRAQARRAQARFQTPADLVSFFEACDRREPGQEPDWEDHLEVIDRSRSDGVGESM